VPSGDSPDGMGRTSPANEDGRILGAAWLVPVGGSPTGTGGSPVLPIFQTRSERSEPPYVGCYLVALEILWQANGVSITQCIEHQRFEI